MYFFLGEHCTHKTTVLFQIAYDSIEKTVKEDTPVEDFAFILTSNKSLDFKNQTLGKYNTISADIIDNIHIKVLPSFTELQNFLLSLLYLDKENFPLMIIIDRINLFFGLQKVNYKEEIFTMKAFTLLMSLFDTIKMVNKEKEVTFAISIDLCIDDLEEKEPQSVSYQLSLLNGILSYANKVYNIDYMRERNEVKCYNTIFDFEPNKFCFFTYENVLVKKIKKKDIDEYTEIEVVINNSIIKFEKLINQYLNQNVSNAE